MHRRGLTDRALRALFCSSVLLVASACADQTAILVRVSSTLDVPSEVDHLDFHVVGETTSMAVDRAFDLSAGWPHTLSLRPGASEHGAVRIEVTATHGGAFVVRRVVRASFVPGRTEVVEIELHAACEGVQCSDGVDCDAMGRCGGAPPDGGTIDGGARDGGLDAGDDAAVDGGPPPECTGPSMCDDGVACTVDGCADGACVHTPDDSLCQDGFVCDPVEDCPLRTCATDEQCDDGRPCNGTETCVETVCQPGAPIDCDDADACTSDRCDDAMRGECVHVTRDADGDLHADATCPAVGDVVADDCDDANPEVLPGTVEICNGIDDDCESGCDEDFTCCRGESGPCATTCGTTGTRVCSGSCSWSVCSPPIEICNAIDDDCNGAPDDVFACVQGATRACTTACGSTGMQTCDGTCAWSSCVAPGETCNAADDDCDGMPDDGFACVRGSSAACTTACGTTGTRACGTECTASATCAPPAEGCNGVDDDCDGMTDETSECTPGSTGACTTSCGTTGSRACGASCTYGSCTPPAEVCNGGDDDCDGRIDETFTCVPGASSTCTAGCGSTGSRTCTSSCTWGGCTAPAESCNGRDDDCDATCDDGFACCAGSSGSCTTTCGTTGARTCSGTCGWSACSPPAEACNGTDDDCNGACDDGFTCCAGRTYSCTTSCGSTGSRVCTAACAQPAICTPPAEACGGGDDDCDGTIDEGFACSPGSTGPCATACGTTGVRTCDPFCGWAACSPPAEVCNGVDDNCNGMTDEGCGTCVGCAGSVAVSDGGGRYARTTTGSVQTGSCGGTGSEHTLTFTLATASDVFNTTHAATGVDTVLYVRSCGCTGPEMGCNNDADGRTTSMLRLSNLAAGTYQVFVDTQGATTGTMVPVDIYVSTPAPASDRCGNPTLIPAGATSLTTNTCTFASDYDLVTVSGATNCPYTGAGDGPERVYYFTVPTTRTVTFSGCNAGTIYDSALFVRSVCNDGTAGSQVMCNDDNCTGSGGATCSASYRSSTSATLMPGLYYLFVDGYGTAGGDCSCGDMQMTITGL